MNICPRLLIFELSDCTLRIFRGYDFSIFFNIEIFYRYFGFFTQTFEPAPRMFSYGVPPPPPPGDRPRSCWAVFINVRLFYHKNKFVPQCIVTWSIQNEITSFQTDSFSQGKNSQQRHWSGFATYDFVA